MKQKIWGIGFSGFLTSYLVSLLTKKFSSFLLQMYEKSDAIWFFSPVFEENSGEEI